MLNDMSQVRLSYAFITLVNILARHKEKLKRCQKKRDTELESLKAEGLERFDLGYLPYEPQTAGSGIKD